MKISLSQFGPKSLHIIYLWLLELGSLFLFSSNTIEGGMCIDLQLLQLWLKSIDPQFHNFWDWTAFYYHWLISIYCNSKLTRIGNRLNRQWLQSGREQHPEPDGDFQCAQVYTIGISSICIFRLPFWSKPGPQICYYVWYCSLHCKNGQIQ